MQTSSPKRITSLQHPLVKHLTKARLDHSYRNENQCVVVSGKILIEEISAHVQPRSLLVVDETILPELTATHLVSEEILKKITGLPTCDGTLAEFPLPSPSPLIEKNFILALDGISDPGNLGTLVRTALAFHWEGVFFLPGCADPFNDKVIRASRGACFRFPFCFGQWTDLLALVKKNNASLLLADISGESFETLPPQSREVLVLGHETRGISEIAKQQGKRITIPMSGRMESLNVAVAGGILLYHLRENIAI